MEQLNLLPPVPLVNLPRAVYTRRIPCFECCDRIAAASAHLTTEDILPLTCCESIHPAVDTVCCAYCENVGLDCHFIDDVELILIGCRLINSYRDCLAAVSSENGVPGFSVKLMQYLSLSASWLLESPRYEPFRHCSFRNAVEGEEGFAFRGLVNLPSPCPSDVAESNGGYTTASSTSEEATPTQQPLNRFVSESSRSEALPTTDARPHLKPDGAVSDPEDGIVY
ncbi:hypothetical protein F4805DRAFT_12226 [Annulohypoxylon moriforme]|nr:hypothetical protein F4805DRAFT_12226 [Annulohypoxylon moriforme]